MAESETEDTEWLHLRLVRKSMADPISLYRTLFVISGAGLLVTTLFPIYWLIAIALTPNEAITNMGYLPNGFNIEVFVQVFQQVPIHWFIFNSLVISVIATVIVLTVGSLAGYAFGRLDFPGRNVLLVLLLFITYFPGTTFLIPLFRLFTGSIEVLGMTTPDLFNTPAPVALSLSGITLPLAIFILTTFFSQIPDGLEDAARIEGCTRLGSLYRVILPLSAPGVATAGILTFIMVYNDFFFSFLMTNGLPKNWAPLVHGLYDYRTLRTTPYNLMAAASLIGLVPVMVLLFYGQKKIVSGLTSGALKE